MKRFFYLVLVFFFVSGHVNVLAGNAFSESVEIRNHIFNLQFDKAHLKISENHSKNGFEKDYLKSYSYFFQAFFFQSEAARNKFMEQSGGSLDVFTTRLKTNPYAAEAYSELQFMRAIIAYQQGNYFTSGLSAVKAMIQAENNMELFKDQPATYKMTALYYFFFGSLPDDFKWMARCIGYEGSIKKGFEFIEKHYQHSLSAGDTVEALILKTLALYNFSDNPENAINFLAHHPSFHPGNTTLALLYSSLLVRNGYSSQAEKLILQHTTKNTRARVCQFEYLLGLARLYQLKPESENNFLLFLQLAGDESAKAMACQKLYWFYCLKNDGAKRKEYREKAIEFGSNSFEKDNDLQQLSRYETYNERLLLKARLLFDGGNYSLAEMELNKIKNKEALPKETILEYHYRMSRIYHKTGRSLQAIAGYQKVLALGKGERYYYAPYSAIQIASIAESAGDNKKAVSYYKTALEINTGEYKNSISRTAKTALNRLKI